MKNFIIRLSLSFLLCALFTSNIAAQNIVVGENSVEKETGASDPKNPENQAQVPLVINKDLAIQTKTEISPINITDPNTFRNVKFGNRRFGRSRYLNASDSVPLAEPEPFAFADFSWLNGNNRQDSKNIRQ